MPDGGARRLGPFGNWVEAHSSRLPRCGLRYRWLEEDHPGHVRQHRVHPFRCRFVYHWKGSLCAGIISGGAQVTVLPVTPPAPCIDG